MVMVCILLKYKKLYNQFLKIPHLGYFFVLVELVL